MNTVELLDQLYGSRDELTRIAVNASPGQGPNPPDAGSVTQLLQARDLVTWCIDQVIASDLKATIAAYQAACDAIAKQTDVLKSLKTTVDDVKKGIAVANQIAGIVTTLIGTVAA